MFLASAADSSRRFVTAAMRCAFIAALLTNAAIGRTEEIALPLRGGSPQRPEFAPAGPTVPGTVLWEAEGLRLKLPAARTALAPVGIRTRFGLRGDFDVQASYEILSADEGVKGFGVGARLFVVLDSPEDDLVSLSRVLRAEGPSFAAFRVSNEGGKPREDSRRVKAKSQRGRLRLYREGETLFFEAADGDQDFERIHAIQIGDVDVREIRLTAWTGDKPAAVDLRWTDASFKAEEFPIRETAAAGFASIWWIGLAVGVIAVAVALSARPLKRLLKM